MSLISKFIFSFYMLFFTVTFANAAGGGYWGFNIGGGIPYTTQYGINYVSSSFSADLSYNQFALDVGLASVKLTKPEINFKWHPFSGSFFLGLGIGQFTLSSTATDSGTSQTVTVDVTATAITPSLGWMWGKDNGGFFVGIDFGYQTPLSPKTTLKTSLPDESSEAYQDAVEQGESYGETALPIFSFLRLGYLF